MVFMLFLLLPPPQFEEMYRKIAKKAKLPSVMAKDLRSSTTTGLAKDAGGAVIGNKPIPARSDDCANAPVAANSNAHAWISNGREHLKLLMISLSVVLACQLRRRGIPTPKPRIVKAGKTTS